MQIPPSQSHAQPFTLLPTSGIFSLKFLMLKIRLNILITKGLRPIWLQRDGSFATKTNLYLPIWDCVPQHRYSIFASGSKNASPGENCGNDIGEQFGGQRGGIKP